MRARGTELPKLRASPVPPRADRGAIPAWRNNSVVLDDADDARNCDERVLPLIRPGALLLLARAAAMAKTVPVLAAAAAAAAAIAGAPPTHAPPLATAPTAPMSPLIWMDL